MKLYPLLFETPNPKDYTSSNEYALINVYQTNYQYTLVNVKAFERKFYNEYHVPTEDLIAASVEIDLEPPKNCAGAKQISTMVASPKYPAAGYLMYCLVSKLINGPIISDRESSTSNSAKKTWARIETSGDWEKIELDNYGYISEPNKVTNTKTYFDFQNSWPDRTITKLAGPKTPPVNDDCTLKGNTPDIINSKLGSANAYIYLGSYNPQPLLDKGKEIIQTAIAKLGKDDIFYQEIIYQESADLFKKLYKGVNG